MTEGGRRVLFDDNTSPTHAFTWAAGTSKGREVQFNHLWSESRDPDVYTALWNVCATPAFLAKTTDGSAYPEVTGALRYRAFDLYGHCPPGQPDPTRPDGYELLCWAPHPAPVEKLEDVLRGRLRACSKSRTAKACQEIGWLFSDGKPDASFLDGASARRRAG